MHTGIKEPRREKTVIRGFRPEQSQKQARSLKFRIYCEADLRLCFRKGENPVFSRCD